MYKEEKEIDKITVIGVSREKPESGKIIRNG